MENKNLSSLCPHRQWEELVSLPNFPGSLNWKNQLPGDAQVSPTLIPISWTWAHCFLSPLPRIRAYAGSYAKVHFGHLSPSSLSLPLVSSKLNLRLSLPIPYSPLCLWISLGKRRASSSPDSQKIFLFPLLLCIQVTELEQKSSLLKYSKVPEPDMTLKIPFLPNQHVVHLKVIQYYMSIKRDKLKSR